MFIKYEFVVTNHVEERKEIIHLIDREAGVGLLRCIFALLVAHNMTPDLLKVHIF